MSQKIKSDTKIVQKHTKIMIMKQHQWVKATLRKEEAYFKKGYHYFIFFNSHFENKDKILRTSQLTKFQSRHEFSFHFAFNSPALISKCVCLATCKLKENKLFSSMWS